MADGTRDLRAVAILSDSHDDLERLAEAVADLRRRGIDRLIHCGDICSAEVVEALTSFDAHWVTGNCDWANGDLVRAMDAAGHTFHGLSGELSVHGLRLGFTHGDRPSLLTDMIASGSFHTVFHGHTHQRRVASVNGTRVVCPGALAHASPPGFAVLNPDGRLEFVDLDS